MNVNANEGGGDCFFLAIANAINNYNYNNQDNRIISGRYGTGGNLFTQKYLRSLVAAYFLGRPDVEQQLATTAVANSNTLNTLFEQQINALKDASGMRPDEDFSPEIYVNIANDIYTSNDNFLVQNINSVPIIIEQYYKPFQPITLGQVKSYIESNNYWANELAIVALSNILKLNIIPLEYLNTDRILRIPFANFSAENNFWDKYVFLYFSNKHYELITFQFKSTIKGVLNSKTVEIFNNNVGNKFLPPFYIILIIFGYYCALVDKNNFTLMSNTMNLIDETIQTTLIHSDLYNNFYRYFTHYFPSCRINPPILSLHGGDNDNNESLIGGAYRYNYPTNYYRQNNNRQNNYGQNNLYNYRQNNPNFYPQNNYYYLNRVQQPEKNKNQLAYFITID